MHTQCTPVQLEFQRAGQRRIQGAFDGGAAVLRETDLRLGPMPALSGCFTDHRRRLPRLGAQIAVSVRR